ncbi:MAG: S-layer homology domain-containing protein, partial [Oscillospiraceae bacterium]|nr:S-layer homology domain-containing protein [Oscillospiraceae bacterium]
CSINTGDAGGYHIDDFFMREVPEDNLLEDGSFNLAMTPITDGTLPSVGVWTSMSWASAIEEEENAHSGANLANLIYNAPGLAAGEYPTFYQDVDVEQDTIYRLTFYAKCWTPAGSPIQPLYYGLRNALTDVWTPVRQLSVDNLTNSYQKITLLFDSQQMTRVRIFAFTVSIATQEYGGYHLDDFKLVRLCDEADCPHEYAVVATAPTCTEAGNTGDTYCLICGVKIAEGTVIPATGHTPGEPVKENEAAATCTTAGGYDTVTYCTVCEAEISREHTDIPATGHTLGEPVKENEVAATCTTAGGYDTVIYCTVCKAEISRVHTNITALGHDYELTAWNWTGVTGATAVFTCKNDASHIETIEATITSVRTEPTAEENGSVVYTASVTFEDKTYTDTKTEILPATGHDYVLSGWDWTDYTTATATFTDNNGGDPITVVADITSERTEPTCEEVGKIVYIATVIFDGKTYTDTRTEPLAALGHHWYEPTYTWTDDNSSVTAARVCERDESHVETETVSTTGEITKPATCTAKGETTYTATFENPAFAAQTKTVADVELADHTPGAPVKENETAPTCTEIGGYDSVVYCSVCGAELSREHTDLEATGHDWNEPTYVWAEDNGSVTATRVCKRDASHIETEKGNTTSEVTKVATYEEEGEITYTATFANPVFAVQTKKVATPKLVKPDLSNPFTDVKDSDYFYDAVLWAFNNGVTTGLDDTHFGPYATCTRGQIVTFLWRALGEPAPTITKNPFVDVKESDYYYKAVLWAYENGVTTGTDATHFAPGDFCKREHAVAFLYRAAGKPAYTNKTNPFTDVSSSAYYYDAVLWAVEKNITKGIDATHFGPSNSCQRCQIVTFLYRFMNP